jgi:phage/conjugal plasmid C-4 type zinc finger TraR family protein
MADDVDMAQSNEERYIASAIRGVTKALVCDPIAQETLDCEDCGNEIPQQRRLAVPWTKRCVDCAQTQERHTRRR